MIKISQEIKDELASFPWFLNCGKPPATPMESCRQLSSWHDAGIACNSDKWINTTENAQGELTEYLSKNFPADYQGAWNKLAREARSFVNAIVSEKAMEVLGHNPINSAFVDCVKWDILNALMEDSYRARHPPLFFSELLKVYRAGHFPCGLEDDGTLLFF